MPKDKPRLTPISFQDSTYTTNNIANNKAVENVEVGQSDIPRVLPRQVSTGSTRGTQTVGYGDTKIDGSNNRISIATSNSTVLLGNTNDGTTGLQVSDNTGTPRLFGGEFADGSVKIKLSQTGHDVMTAGDDNLVWSSDFNMFKIVASGTTSITPVSPLAGATPQTSTVSHNLGYIPAFQAFVTNPDLSGLGLITNNFTNLPDTIFVTDGGGTLLVSTAGVDTTNIYFSLTYLDGGFGDISGLNVYTWQYKYYLFKETAGTVATTPS